jgi:hypothetical protein
VFETSLGYTVKPCFKKKNPTAEWAFCVFSHWLVSTWVSTF